jgi:ankyrin repeat protein
MKLRMLATILLLAASATVSGAPVDDLFNAVRAGDSGRIKALLQGGADVNVRDDLGATPLMNAVALPGQDCVRALLDAGADVNAVTTTGATALMWATGQTPNVRLLLEHGADLNAKAKSGATALLTATRRANPEALESIF